MATETPASASDKRLHLEEVRDEDLEPYLTLRYIARLFKIFAILLIVLMIGEIVTGLVGFGSGAILNLIGEATKLLVIAGLMWAGGDVTLLLIDAGHDLRVARILLGRINASMHGEPMNPGRPSETTTSGATTAGPTQSRA